MRQVLLGSLLIAMLAGAGCYVEGPGPAYAGDENDEAAGDLVEVSPGVEVVADQPEPIFFADDYYWVNRGGIWYSSTWYGGGWLRNDHVPLHVSGIPNRGGYVHYRPAGYVAHEHIRGGYASHEQYHAAHASSGVHIRAAVRGGHH